MAKLTKSGAPRKPRRTDDTAELFPTLHKRDEMIKSTKTALKAIRRAWKVEGQWPTEQVADLILTLSELVRPGPLIPPGDPPPGWAEQGPTETRS